MVQGWTQGVGSWQQLASEGRSRIKIGRKQEAAIAALLSQRNVEEAARTAGVGKGAFYGFLAGRTGLTPNLLCRIGFCLSLADPAIPDPAMFPEEDREFNRYKLLGEYDPLFALLRQRCHKDGIKDIRDTMDDHHAKGYFLAVASHITSDLTDHLDRLRTRGEYWADWWNRTEIEDRLNKHSEIAERYTDLVSRIEAAPSS